MYCLIHHALLYDTKILYTLIAASVINNMDSSVDPCDDFYQFACGNFIKETIIDDDKTSHTTFSAISDSLLNKLRLIITEPIQPNEQKPFKMAKLLYKSCMDKGIDDRHKVSNIYNCYRTQ